MEFRRITGLPPYVFAIINDLKIEKLAVENTIEEFACTAVDAVLL